MLRDESRLNARRPTPIATPMGWLPPNSLANVAEYLTPSRTDVADNLGWPVDAMGWLLKKAGLPIPGVQGPANRYGANTWLPSGDVPSSSAYFKDLFDRPSSIRWRICTALCAGQGSSSRHRFPFIA